MRVPLIFSFLVLTTICFGQVVIPQNGTVASRPAYYALKNATIYVSPTKKILKGTLLIKDNKIIKVGPFVSVPNEAVTIDCSNKIILAAFIELNSKVGLPKVSRATERKKGPQLESNKRGPYYWNESVHPEINAASLFEIDNEGNKALIEKGFGFALTHQQDGIARGKAVFVSLGGTKKPFVSTLTSASVFSFDKGVSRQSYPSSQMGAIALLRQAFYDAEWYKSNATERNLSLDALNEQLTKRLFFNTADKLEILRAEKIATEFGYSFAYFGSGNEYEIVNSLKQLDATLVLPVNFPKAYDVSNPYISRQIPLSELKHWELAPMNPAILSKNNISICLSSDRSKSSKSFWSNIRKTIKHGLTAEQALEALTTRPARTLGIEKIVGTLEPGNLASFMIYDNNPFEQEAQILESWNLGIQAIFDIPNKNKISGKYTISFGEKKYHLVLTGNAAHLKGKVSYTKNVKKGKQDTTVNVLVSLNENDINLQFNVNEKDLIGSIALHGKVNTKFGVFEGDGFLPNGKWIKWSAVKSGRVKSQNEPRKKIHHSDTTNSTWYPNMAYGFSSTPIAETIVIKNATLWTNEAEGIIEDATLIIENGKISFVGSGSYNIPAGARIIDAKGKVVSSGIIDEHSHIAISKGVNESGQAVSAEVSIKDVVNPDDINIYRQLSGGVTASQLLHGSANPIGGQSALVKLKWGHTAEEMLIENAPKFIKFALGENVKQSNWGDHNTIRFPQTRMGVEQVFYDGFSRAKEYAKSWEDYENGLTDIKPNVDLELQVLNEILKGERFVTCHSYIQSEINMLMHVADSMGFTLNTFTHILEGYKVADKMAKHGAGGSTFSDWWAYKYEVNDAIPHNAAIMSKQGVVVAINSDDAEMGRRLNQEAAKGVKYGGMSEKEAWKMVTLNPAKLLHLEKRMGSLKEGKDADVVVWSDNPLSIKAKVEYTIVDGMVLFDSKQDREMRIKNQSEKARIISKMLSENEAGEKTRSFKKKENGYFHCNTIGEVESNEENQH